MTSIEAAIAQIERDRRQREEGLLLFLLALARRTRRQVNAAIRTGGSWLSMLRDTLLGREALDLPGGVDVLARGMADSHVAGYKRVGQLVGVELPPEPDNVAPLTPQQRQRALDALALVYATPARETLERAADGLQTHVGRALADAQEADSIAADLRAVRTGFGAAGWTPNKPRTAQAEASRAVVTAYGSGMAAAYNAPGVAEWIIGMRFVTVQDERRTEICRARHGIQLPLADPWWNRNQPALHWGCRSTWVPLVRPFVPTPQAELWDLPAPMPGFGMRGVPMGVRQTIGV